VKFGILGTARFMFRPVRVFRRLEGWFLCRAGRGRELGCNGIFVVHRRQKDVLFDHLTKFISPTTKIYSPN